MKKNLILSKEEILERVWDNIGRMEERFYTDGYTEEDVQEMNFWQDLHRIVDAYEEEKEMENHTINMNISHTESDKVARDIMKVLKRHGVSLNNDH